MIRGVFAAILVRYFLRTREIYDGVAMADTVSYTKGVGHSCPSGRGNLEAVGDEARESIVLEDMRNRWKRHLPFPRIGMAEDFRRSRPLGFS